MKIALLSFHNAANYGAALQAYALEKFLTDKGIDCEYINYVNESRAHEYSMTWHIYDCLRHGKIKSAIAYLLGSPFMTLRKYRFNKFYAKYLRVTEKIYHSSKEAIELNTQYDYFIVGSDQVWNPICNGNDSAFLLDFVEDNTKRISYSSSFGVTEIDDTYKSVYRSNLECFSHLAVRESIGQSIISELTHRSATLVLDPVLLLTKKQWNDIMPNGIIKEKFIFSYTNRDSQIADFFNTGYQLGKRKHYVLSRYTNPQDFVDPQIRVKYCMSPQEFLWVIKNADMVVTASFHCVALSIVLNRPFVAILTGDKGKDERLLSLLKSLNLESRILSPQTDANAIESPINYNLVNEKITEMKKTSIDYLLGALNQI